MKKVFLLASALLALSSGVSAQQTVKKLFRVSDGTFNVNFWPGPEDHPNSSNPVVNSFTIGGEFGAVSWDFDGGAWWDANTGLDISGYDKLVIDVASCVGNNLQFRIFDYNGRNGGSEYKMPDDIVESDEDIQYEIDLTDKDAMVDTKGNAIDLSKIHNMVFWNYWDVDHSKSTDSTRADYDPTYVDLHPGADVTVTIKAMYLERTLKNGEKDYVDLLAGQDMQFTDSFLADDGGSPSYIDNTGTLHMNENAEAGFFYDENPQDWSKYKYLVVVPQKPFTDGDNTIRYLLTDADDNCYDGGSLRYGLYNRARAAVQDLTNITNETMDDNSKLENFDPSAIASLKWSLWGGVSAWEYSIAGVWLSNTAPTYSTSIGDGTDNTGDYVIENSAENTVTTICLPYAAALCGAQAYTVAGIDDPSHPTELYAKPYYGILEAGKPYIIRTNSTRNVTAFRAGANETTMPKANGALTADQFTTYYVEGGKNYLVLNEDGDTFEAVGDDDEMRVNSNTAYIDCSKLQKATEVENGLVFTVTDAKPFTPTAISRITTGKTPQGADNAIYDLAGRRVSKPTKGIYIRNGKKVVVK